MVLGSTFVTIFGVFADSNNEYNIKYRTGVSALIINPQNQLLLVNLQSFEDKYFAIPGGGLEPQEDLETAIFRELFEELNISKASLELVGKSDQPIRFKFKHSNLVRDGQEYEGQERYFFGFRLLSDPEITPKAGEVRSFKWVDTESLEKYLYAIDR